MKAVDGDRQLYAVFSYVDESGEDVPRWAGEVVTYCRIEDIDRREVSGGVSYKSIRDQFSRKRGREIALGRAIHRMYPDDSEKRHALLREFLSSARVGSGNVKDKDQNSDSAR